MACLPLCDALTSMTMADIYFQCRCGKHLAVDEQGIGQQVRCPACGTQFMVPSAAVQWACEHCGAFMLATAEMRATTVQCQACDGEVQVPPAPERPAQSATPAAQTENLAELLHKVFKHCPRCNERLPAKPKQCPHCGYVVQRRSARPLIIGLLALLILALAGAAWLRGGACLRALRPPPAPPPATQPEPLAVAVPEAPEPITPVADLPSSAPDLEEVNLPLISQEQWQARLAAARKLMGKQLDRAHPRYREGETLRLNQLNGLILHGIHAGASASGLTLLTADEQNTPVEFKDLDLFDRLKTDPDFRMTWLEVQSAALSRNSLEEEGYQLPTLTSVASRMEALAWADPQAQYQEAQQHYQRKDYAGALLYFQAAAQQQQPAAQYALGVMNYQGVGLRANRKEGLQWLVQAAAQGSEKAERYLEQLKISSGARQQLLQQVQARQDSKRREEAVELKAYAKPLQP